MASVTALRELLEPTSLPPELVDEVLADTNTLWLLGAPDELVAGELVLCHPPLGRDEVRAVVNATDHPRQWRVTVVTQDRPGLLAASSAALARAGLSIVDAAVAVLPRSRLALQRLTFVANGGRDPAAAAWTELGRALRENLKSRATGAVAFEPRRPVTVEAQPQELGRSVVTVEAPDGMGLLHATAAWLAAAGCNVEACRAGVEHGRAREVFIVNGPLDTAALATALGGPDDGTVVTKVVTTPLHVSGTLVGSALRTALAALTSAANFAAARCPARRGHQ